MSKIRPPSPTLNRLRPVSFPKRTKAPVKGLAEAKSYSEAFLACLIAYIAELRSSRQKLRRVKLVNGEQQKEIHKNVYTFVLDDRDLDNFKGSRVRVRIKGAVYSGLIVKITNLSPKILYLEINNNFGSTIDNCEIEQDDAALYEALLDRYSIELDKKEERSIKKVESDFTFADRVIENKPQVVKHNIKISQKDLNSDQLTFVEKALGHDISYLWGPPGTGKTQCLGTLITAFYNVAERSVITSNTNQAVDQVLLKLCRELKANDRMEELEKGRILRDGTIKNIELKAEFGEYLDIKSVTKIVAKPLNQKLKKLEQEQTILKIEATTFPELRTKIQQSEFWENEVANLAKQEKKSRDLQSAAQKKLDELASNHDKLKKEINAIGQRGLIQSIFGKSRSKLELEISNITPELERARDLLESLERDHLEIEEKLNEKKKSRDEHLKLTGGLTLNQLNERQANSDKRLHQLGKEIKEILKELNNLSDKIIHDARVIGATLTTIYLIPTKIGKFQNLVIDEASMPTLPAVHFASSMATKRVVVSGDFRQIPPIFQSNNPEIEHWLGNNIFLFERKNESPISDIFTDELELPNAHMLKWQYRMPSEICELISNFSYNSLLKSAPIVKEIKSESPKGFEGSVVVLDTSDVGPFCDITASWSRSNSIHALIAERVAKKFIEYNANETVGYLSPYRAQSDLAEKILRECGLAGAVAAGTVHTFQGDEKDTIIFDTVDGLGGANNAGAQISKDNPAEANLLNVAMSRARQRIIIIANLQLLDQTLPAMAFLRKILAKAEELNHVISCGQLLPFQKIEASAKASLMEKQAQVSQLLEGQRENLLQIKQTEKELQLLKDNAQRELQVKLAGLESKEKSLSKRSQAIKQNEVELDQKSEILREKEAKLEQQLRTLVADNNKLKKSLAESALTIIDGLDFTSLFEHDIRSAQRSVVIYSGFATANRVQKLIPLFTEAIARGVKMRVVVRWEGVRGFYTKERISAVELLQRTNVAVDLRAEVHQKAILIDDKVSWNGSLNPLSFNETKSSETMWRVEGTTTTMQFGRELALEPYRIKNFTDLVKIENPRCAKCKSFTQFHRFRIKKFVCVSCGAVTPFGRKIR